MERTGGTPVRSRLLQRDIVLHDADDVRLSFEIFDEGLRETHFRISILRWSRRCRLAPEAPQKIARRADDHSEIALRNAPVPWPWIMRSSFTPFKKASSKNLSTRSTASSVFLPMRFSSL